MGEEEGDWNYVQWTILDLISSVDSDQKVPLSSERKRFSEEEGKCYKGDRASI